MHKQWLDDYQPNNSMFVILGITHEFRAVRNFTLVPSIKIGPKFRLYDKEAIIGLAHEWGREHHLCNLIPLPHISLYNLITADTAILYMQKRLNQLSFNKRLLFSFSDFEGGELATVMLPGCTLWLKDSMDACISRMLIYRKRKNRGYVQQ